jgi:hypothetical protein
MIQKMRDAAEVAILSGGISDLGDIFTSGT